MVDTKEKQYKQNKNELYHMQGNSSFLGTKFYNSGFCPEDIFFDCQRKRLHKISHISP